jgi:CRP-like cAMP-binding protein
MALNDSTMLAPLLTKLAGRCRLNSDEADAVLALPYRQETARAGSHLHRQGDRVDRCTVLLSGFACRNKFTGEGARQILGIHLQGDAIDLQNSLLGITDDNVQALTAVEIAHIPLRAMEELVARYPNVGRALWIDVLTDTSIYREWLVNIGRRDARQRLAHLLCELVVRQEAVGLCSGPNYHLPLTQEQIGDATGLTPVHVNRTLQRLRGEGLVELYRHSVTVIDWPGLQTAGDFSSLYLHLTGPAQDFEAAMALEN